MQLSPPTPNSQHQSTPAKMTPTFIPGVLTLIYHLVLAVIQLVLVVLESSASGVDTCLNPCIADCPESVVLEFSTLLTHTIQDTPNAISDNLKK